MNEMLFTIEMGIKNKIKKQRVSSNGELKTE